jgi:hypothetical protein
MLIDRLRRAFADMRTYGVDARCGVEMDVAHARNAALARILEHYPDAIGSYIFWTRADELRYTRNGLMLDNSEGFPIYHSSAEVADAAQSICARQGVTVVVDDDSHAARLLAWG